MAEEKPPESEPVEVEGPDLSPADAFAQSIQEVETKMERHQRELLQRLNFQDEVLSLLLIAKPPGDALEKTEIYHQEQRRPPEPSAPAERDQPHYGSKGTSRQQTKDLGVMEISEDMDLDGIEASHSRQASYDSALRKEAVLIDVQQQLDKIGSSKPRLFRTHSEKEEALRRDAAAIEVESDGGGEATIDEGGRPEGGVACDQDSSASFTQHPHHSRRSTRTKNVLTWQEMDRWQKLQRVVSSPLFEAFFSLAIITNAVVLGVDVQNFAQDPGPATAEMEVIGQAFTVLFLVELVARLLAFGPRGYFFDPKQWAWNLLDFVIVSSGVVEALVQITMELMNQAEGYGVSTLSNLRVLRIIRITRLIRLTRIARIARFIKALRTLVTSIVFTLKSLIWALVLLSLIIYGFGIVFTQASVLYRIDPENSALVETLVALDLYWADLPASMLTLFMSISGGVSWEAALRPMEYVSPWCAYLFLFYIAFSYFAVLNVVTGVFCQSAIESAQSDHEMIMQSIIQNKEAHIKKVRSLFSNLDADDSGYISLVELENNMHKSSVQTYFEALELDVSDAWTFFKLLDTDGGAAIEIEEFLLGCLRLRGPARALDLAKVQHEQQWMAKSLGTFMGHVEVSLRKMEAGLLKLCELQLDQQLDTSSGVPSVPEAAKRQPHSRSRQVSHSDSSLQTGAKRSFKPPAYILRVQENTESPAPTTPPANTPPATSTALPVVPQADSSPAPSSEGVTHVNHVILPRGAQEQDTSVLLCESRAEQL